MRNLKFLSVLSMLLLLGTVATAQEAPQVKVVGGAEMYASRNIIANAVNSKDHTSLVAAVKAAELVEILQSDGPFTVFAPTNSAFEALPAGTVESLLKPENKKKLQAVLTYHVVAGDLNAEAIIQMIEKGNGKAGFKTLNGGELWSMLDGDRLKLKDGAGNIATVTIADVKQSNGVIHVIDGVLLPAN